MTTVVQPNRGIAPAVAVAALALAVAAHAAVAAPKTIGLTAVDGYPPRALQV